MLMTKQPTLMCAGAVEEILSILHFALCTSANLKFSSFELQRMLYKLCTSPLEAPSHPAPNPQIK